MEMLSKFSKREKLFLYMVIIFISCALLDRIVIRPIDNKFKQLSEDILIQEKLLGKNLRNLAQKDIIFSEHKQFEDYAKPLGSDEENMAKFLNDIEKFARDSAVYLADIKPRPIIKMDFYERYIVEVEAEAEIKGVINFLYKIETSEGLLRIEQLQLVPKKIGSPVLEGIIIITKVLIP